MSYIRCLSNPEGLYIYDCMLGPANKQEHFVVISDGDNITIPYTVPFKTFEGLLRKYRKWNIGKDGHFEYKGLSLNICFIVPRLVC